MFSLCILENNDSCLFTFLKNWIAIFIKITAVCLQFESTMMGYMGHIIINRKLSLKLSTYKELPFTLLRSKLVKDWKKD